MINYGDEEDWTEHGEEWKKGYGKNDNDLPSSLKKNWKGYQHVYPLNDLIEHVFDITTDSDSDTYPCPCNPKIDYENKIIIHAAMDRRACYEN